MLNGFMKKCGFTLVELSIVLVIIGLLIGGILAGQSMISTAKIQGVVRQLQQYDVAVSTFQTKFNSLPGDTATFGTGNNDGMITGTSGTIGSFTNEIANFWLNLQQGGFTYSGKAFTSTVPAGGFDINSNSPNSPMINADVKGGVVAFKCDLSSVNCYQLADWTGVSVDIWPNLFGANPKPILTTANAFAIDSKMDDGNPATGNVRDFIATLPPVYNGYFYCDDVGSSDPANAKYVLAYKGNNCVLTVSLLSQVGQAK